MWVAEDRARSTTPASPTAPTTWSPWSPRRWSCSRAAGADDPAATLRPLLTAALDNALAYGDAALTGPIVRGDVDTVRAHLADIAANAPADARVVRRAGPRHRSTAPSPTAGCCRSGRAKLRRRPRRRPLAPAPGRPPPPVTRCVTGTRCVAHTREELAAALAGARARRRRGSPSCRRWARCTRATPA